MDKSRKHKGHVSSSVRRHKQRHYFTRSLHWQGGRADNGKPILTLSLTPSETAFTRDEAIEIAAGIMAWASDTRAEQ